MTLREIQEEMECFGCEGVSFKGFLCASCWRMSSRFPKRIRRQARKGNVYYQKRLKTLLVVAQSRAFLNQKQAKIRQCVELLQDMQADLWLTGRISESELKDLVRPEMLRWFARQYTGDHVGSSAAAEVEIEWARQNWPLDFKTRVTRPLPEMGPAREIYKALLERKPRRQRRGLMAPRQRS